MATSFMPTPAAPCPAPAMPTPAQALPAPSARLSTPGDLIDLTFPSPPSSPPSSPPRGPQAASHPPKLDAPSLW
eukprot:1650931-Pleurochrysis_carterae.AAC.1